MEPPRCFISYSWDSEQHREWVRKLTVRMRENGIDAILDQFHCKPGTDLAKFMETSVRESNFVLLVCTPNFVQKADAGVGGVGYEKAIVTGEIFTGEAEETKFVPLLREGDAKESLPSYLKSRLFTDFRDDSLFETKLEELLRHFHDEPLYTPPPIGPKPDWKKPTVTKPAKKPTVTKPAKKPSVSKPVKKPSLEQTFKNSIGMKFVLIPAGSFMMGSPPEESGRKNDEKQHEVTISKPYYLQTIEVAQWQWEKVMGDNPSSFSKSGDDRPVESVSWDDVQKFIKKLNEMEGNDKFKYRLPTEAEWEYACRANTRTLFYFGNTEEELKLLGWYHENSGGQTHPVGEKEPNEFGLYDMHGNVWEWCQDWYDKHYYRMSSEENPLGPQTGADRVIRGGSWFLVAQYCRAANRFYFSPVNRFYDLGFRLARSVALDP